MFKSYCPISSDFNVFYFDYFFTFYFHPENSFKEFFSNNSIDYKEYLNKSTE